MGGEKRGIKVQKKVKKVQKDKKLGLVCNNWKVLCKFAKLWWLQATPPLWGWLLGMVLEGNI